jgi:hypothetical protein
MISFEALKQLLIALKHEQPETLIRFRLSDRPWTENFLSVGILSQIQNDGSHSYAALFNDLKDKKTVLVKDIAQISEFELNASYEAFRPYRSYEVARAI